MHAYLKIVLQRNYDEMRSMSAGGPQPNLNVQKVKDLYVPLPPLAEQHRIVARVNEVMALCDRLETGLATVDTAGHHLLESALFRALVAAA